MEIESARSTNLGKRITNTLTQNIMRDGLGKLGLRLVMGVPNDVFYSFCSYNITHGGAKSIIVMC